MKIAKQLTIALVGIALLASTTGSAANGESRPHVAADLAVGPDPVRVIVTYRADVRSEQIAEFALSTRSLATRLDVIHGLAGRLAAEEIETLKDPQGGRGLSRSRRGIPEAGRDRGQFPDRRRSRRTRRKPRRY